MKHLVLLSTFALFASFSFSQSTTQRVYQIFQEKCASCHSHVDPQSGLDLEGVGATMEARALDMYNNIVNIRPTNEASAQAGHQYIYPGRADRSFIFRKINQGLESTIGLGAGEKDVMPPADQPQLTDVEKELIRQWILFGSPKSGEVVREQTIADFYNVNGLKSFPDGPPPAPSPEEGFQIKMGPFYLEPGGELEYFQLHQLDLPENVEVNRLGVQMSSYSHHFILYDYATPQGASSVKRGFRTDINHTDQVGITATVQEPTDLMLPRGTAFFWDKDLMLDLNSHYINYSNNHTLQAEVYLNVYTQPMGNAVQEMQAQLVPNIFIPIPNNGNLITHTATARLPGGQEIFTWILGGHTHRYGKGYKIWKRLPNGDKGEIIYDGACPNGVPGCVSPFFDYQHIPPRYFEPLLPVDLNDGVIHEATYINDGPVPVGWGPTSQDEMMLFALFFVTDTTGLGGLVSNTLEFENPLEEIRVYPNPMQEETTIYIPNEIGTVRFQLFDAMGRELRRIEQFTGKELKIKRAELTKGMYLYRIEDQKGRYKTGKLIIKT